jgi:hypothetical protein
MTNKGLRWVCSRDGCFNEVLRPRLQVFADCFARGANFGDVDGLVELNGAFALLEWKNAGGVVKLGQLRAHLKFTRRHTGNVVFLVGGDARTMQVRNFAIVWQGRAFATQQADLNELKQRIRAWAEWAESLRGVAA